MLWQLASRLLAQTPASAAVDFGLEQSLIPIEAWDQGGANQFRVSGRLMLGGKPVAGARMALDAYVSPTATDDDGAFKLSGDKTVLSRLRVHVGDASGATIGGGAASSTDQETLKSAETVIETAFPIMLDPRSPVTPGGTVQGRITFSDMTSPAPSVALWGYELKGTIFDESGKPLSGAYASVSDDQGETWAVSPPTVADGNYRLRFFPTADTDFYVRVTFGQTFLESVKALSFQTDTSAQLDLVAAASRGTVVGTGDGDAFDITQVPGAEYIGQIVGLAVDDLPLDAGLTWPDEQGGFTVTLPSSLPQGQLGFFQLRLRFFTAEPVKPGGPVAAGIVPSPLDTRAPRNLPPLLSTG